MSKVYVVSETTHNIVSAQQYGEIVTILPPNTQIAFSPAPTVRRIKRALEKLKWDKREHTYIPINIDLEL